MRATPSGPSRKEVRSASSASRPPGRSSFALSEVFIHVPTDGRTPSPRRTVGALYNKHPLIYSAAQGRSFYFLSVRTVLTLKTPKLCNLISGVTARRVDG